MQQSGIFIALLLVEEQHNQFHFFASGLAVFLVFWHTVFLRSSNRQKCNGVKSGDWGEYPTLPLCPIHLLKFPLLTLQNMITLVLYIPVS
jgi:hypothetical protein